MHLILGFEGGIWERKKRIYFLFFLFLAKDVRRERESSEAKRVCGVVLPCQVGEWLSGGPLCQLSKRVYRVCRCG